MYFHFPSTLLAWVSPPLPVEHKLSYRRRPFHLKSCAPNPPRDPTDQHSRLPHPESAQTPATPILSALLSESNRVNANFFCPGHKQGAHTHPAFLSSLHSSKPLSLDLPELPALDNLFCPEGVIEQSQHLAADTFTPTGSRHWDTFFLINGSTCGLQAALLATLRPSRRIILPRNVHQSVVHALVLTGAIPVWLDPLYDSHLDLLHGISVASVTAALEQWQGQVDTVLVVSPTYHGVCSDIAAIARVAHEYGAKCVVDEAHGAHFAFHRLLPETAASCGADIVVQSTHKTLGAMSQAAMLHVRKTVVNRQQMVAALQLVQSTSPNYMLLASLEAARAEMDARGKDLMSKSLDLARTCAVRIASLKGFEVLGVDNVGMRETNSDGDRLVFALDQTRVTVILPRGVTGYELDTHLIDRFGVYCELPSFKHMTFVLTPGNTKEDVDRLVLALSLYEATSVEEMIFEGLNSEMPSTGSVFGKETGLTPRDAFFADSEVVAANEAVGRICAETLCPYPPGVPVLVPGERITEDCVHVLRKVLDMGGSVSGASDECLSTIRVLAKSEGPGDDCRE